MNCDNLSPVLRQLFFAAALAISAASPIDACPARAPFAGLTIESPCSEEQRACWTEYPIRFTTKSFGYTIQSCDIAVWTFGDGTMASVGGNGEVTHSYASPGNYRVTLEIRNAMGSAHVREHRVAVSDFPAYISIPFERRVIPESNTTTDVVVHRSGDLDEKVTVDYEVYGAPTAETWGTLVFPPGVTRQTIRIGVLDDELYGGDPWNWISIRLLRPTGGTVLKTIFFNITVTDDEPRAVISAPHEIVVSEHDGVIRIPVRASWPLAGEMDFGYSVIDGSAKGFDDFVMPRDPIAGFPTRFGRGKLAPGQTTADIEIPLVDDGVAEAAESFRVTIYDTQLGFPFSPMETVVIIRDDEGGRRRAVR